jgi:hypothetical protein
LDHGTVHDQGVDRANLSFKPAEPVCDLDGTLSSLRNVDCIEAGWVGDVDG